MKPEINCDRAALHAAWDEILENGHFSEGVYVRRLEDLVEASTGLYACAVNSAGTGLYTMLRCLKLPPHRPVAVSVNTFYATAGMAREAGHPLVLIDCNRRDFSMSYDNLVSQVLLPGAVILTHVGGILAPDYVRISEFCEAHGIPLLEDAAHSLGLGWANGYTTPGQYSKGAVYSLYPTKAVPAGEGGIIVSDDESFIQACREFRNYGKVNRAGVITYNGSGFNFRMDEWTAAVAYHQCLRIEEITDRRQEAADRLQRLISPAPGFAEAVQNMWYKYPVLRDEAGELGITRYVGHIYQSTDQIHHALGITTQGTFPAADWVAERACCLPINETHYSLMGKDEMLSYLRGEC